MTDETHHINESADKIVLKTKLTRGTGTRDQEKLDVKVKGSDPEEVVGKMNDTLERLTETAEFARGMQPE